MAKRTLVNLSKTHALKVMIRIFFNFSDDIQESIKKYFLESQQPRGRFCDAEISIDDFNIFRLEYDVVADKIYTQIEFVCSNQGEFLRNNAKAEVYDVIYNIFVNDLWPWLECQYPWELYCDGEDNKHLYTSINEYNQPVLVVPDNAVVFRESDL